MGAAGRSIAWPLILIACSACGSAIYDKPGLTYTEWKRDDTECRLAARREESGETDPRAYARCLRERGYRVPE